MPTHVHVLELGQTTIGIAVPEERRFVRFFAAGAPYDRLDGRAFRDTREILAAARALRRPRRRAS